MIWRRLHSRSGVPIAPRKYFVVTMFAELTLQKSGNSTPRCSKLTEPSRQLVITTSRRSQVTSSYGCTPSVVQSRSSRKPAVSVIPVPPRSRGHAATHPLLPSGFPASVPLGRLLRRPQVGDLPLEIAQRVERAVHAGE